MCALHEHAERLMMVNPTKKVKRKPRLMLRVIKGGFAPADDFVRTELRQKGYKIGDIVAADITQCRNPGFHRLAHRIGTLCTRNIDDFAGMDAHKVLKRLQLEANIGCEAIFYKVAGYGMLEQRIPQSLSFENMDESEFRVVVKGFCRYISENYWPSMDAESIEEMADSMIEEF